jgi:hypothetical protein
MEEQGKSYALARGDQAKRGAKERPQRVIRAKWAAAGLRKICAVCLSTGFARAVHNFSTRPVDLRRRGVRIRGGYNSTGSPDMNVIRRPLIAVLLIVLPARLAVAAADPTLLRLFLTDGSSLVSFGEFARVGERVIFSMPIGGTATEPHLYAVSIPASTVDWTRTDRYSSSARYQWYATTRGEADFEQISGEVARVLNEIAVSTDRTRALAIAEDARRVLAVWPAEHFGYRNADVREIVSLLDESISNLRATLGIGQFELALVAPTPDVPLEPLLGMPSPGEQFEQVLRVARLTGRAAERVALLQAALTVLDQPNVLIAGEAAAVLRKTIGAELRKEADIDARYASLSQSVMKTVTRDAEKTRIADIERVLARLPDEDRRLGNQRPDAIEALRVSVRSQLAAARQLRLLKDRWTIRRALYRDWQRSAGVQLLRLVKERSALEAIQRLDGPDPDTLLDLRREFGGGAARLERIGIGAPQELREVNDLLVGAWRFAETAVNARYAAASAGDLGRAREASSAAAAALIMLDRTQSEIRTLLEPPTLR